MPVTMPQVTGWPTYQPMDLASIYDPFAGVKMAQAVEDLQRGNVLRKIESIKLQDLQRESGISEQMLGAGRELLNQTPGGNALAPSAPSAPSAQPQQQPSGSPFSPSGFGPMGFQAQPGIRSLSSPSGNVTGSPFTQPSIGQVPQYGQPSGAVAPWPTSPERPQAPQAPSPGGQAPQRIPQAPEMVRLSNGMEVPRDTINRFPQYFAQLEMKTREAQAQAATTRMNTEADAFDKNMATAIEADPSRARGMAQFYALTSKNPSVKSKAQDFLANYKNLGGGDFRYENYYSSADLDILRKSLPPEENIQIPAEEGLYKYFKEKGKVTFEPASPTDNQLADWASNSASPKRQAWATRIRDARTQDKLTKEGFKEVGITANGGTVSAKGGRNFYWHPTMGDKEPVPWNQQVHGKILPKTESYVERIQKGEDFIGTPEERRIDVDLIRSGQLDPTKVATGGGMGGYGLAYSREIRRDVDQAQKRIGLPNFNYTLANQNFKYMDNPNTLRSIGLSQAVLPRVYAMESKIDRIGNKFGVPVLDAVWNKIRKDVLGEVGLTDYESLRNDIIQEVNTALSGTSVSSDSRLQLELERLKTSATPRQLKTAIANLKSALQARIDSGVMIPNPWEVVRGEVTQKEWFKSMNEGRNPKDIRGNIVELIPERVPQLTGKVEQRKPGESISDYLRRTGKQ